MLTTPKMDTIIPEAITMLQELNPRDSSLVASLLRFPRMETPTMIMMIPKVTKPEEGDSRGQL